ncbi:unnamed protein product, partial [marine sediment metagenome]
PPLFYHYKFSDLNFTTYMILNTEEVYAGNYTLNISRD